VVRLRRSLHLERPRQVEHVGLALEERLVGEAVERRQEVGVLGSQRFLDLCRRPDVGRALLTVSVGVEARREAPVRGQQLALGEGERLLGHRAVAVASRELPGMDVDARQLGVVVEHLLEVRHQPGLVRAVTREAAAQVVVDAARGHGIERAPSHGQRSRIAGQDVQPEQELDRHRLWELGRPAPAAVVRVEAALQPEHRRVEHRIGYLGRAQGAAAHRRELAADLRRQSGTGPLHLIAPLAPGLAHALEHLAERWHAVPGLIGKYVPP
jgi:hypothetical protein